MSAKNKQRKCRCCNVFFTPDCHNPNRQFYCSAPDCRRASKAASQRRWLQKPANRNYFRDAENVQRVQQWRKSVNGSVPSIVVFLHFIVLFCAAASIAGG